MDSRRILIGLAIIFTLALVATPALHGWGTARNERGGAAEPDWQVPGGDPERGRQAIRRYGCAGCHTIAGIEGANARVGPVLTGLRGESYIAGRLPNASHYLVWWIRDPQRFGPGSAMPNLHVTEGDARDIAAYLYQGQ
jgi:cytochrome c